MAVALARLVGPEAAVIRSVVVGTSGAVLAAMHTTPRLIGLHLIIASLVGCAAPSSDVEDGEHDTFFKADAKADAFGVADRSPDAAAVLQLVNTAGVSELHELGLSTRVADEIVVHRSTIGEAYADLAELDGARYVGNTVFDTLRDYAVERQPATSALFIPLMIGEQDTYKTLIDTFNATVLENGLPAFPRYMFVGELTHFLAKIEYYDRRLEQLAAAAHITIAHPMMRAAYLGPQEYAAGGAGVCFLGPPDGVGAILGAEPHEGVDGMFGTLFELWAWRLGTAEWVDHVISDPSREIGYQWNEYPTTSDKLRLFTTVDTRDTMGYEELVRCP